MSMLQDKNVRMEIDLSNESVGKKIREAVLEKIPYLLVIGDKEVADNTVSVRLRGSKDTITMPYSEFETKILENINSRSLTL